MKGNKHIKSFNEASENLNISDVMNSILSELKQDLDDAKWAKRDKETNYENSQFFDGKIKGLEMSIEKIENLIKYYSVGCMKRNPTMNFDINH